MDDKDKSKEQLLDELILLKQELAELRKTKGNYEQVKSDLVASEEKYRILFESSRDAIMIIEPPDWYFTDGNPATIEMFRASDREEFTSKKPGELSPKYQPDGELSSIKAKAMIDEAMNLGAKFFEWTHKRIDGEEFPATVLLTRVELGDETFLEATVRDITDRKHAEQELTKHRNHLQELIIDQTEELRRSELQFRTLSDNIPGVVYLCDNDENFTIIYINDEVEKLTGYSRKEFLDGKVDFDRLYHPDDRKYVYEEVDKALKEKKAFHINSRIKHKNGQWKHIEEHGTAVYQDGKLQYLEGFIRDVTIRIKAEDELRRLSRVVEQSPTTILITDLKGNIEYVNPNFSKISGYGTKEIIGENITIMDSGVRSEEIFKNVWDTLSVGKIWKGELYNKRKDGEFFWESASISPIIDKQGRKTHYVKIAIDITEHKKNQEKLKDSEEKLKNILENSTNMFYSHTVDHHLTYVSPQAKDILGYMPEEVMIKWTDLVSDNPINEHGYELTMKAIETGEQQPGYEVEVLHKSGKKVWVEVHEAPIVENGKTVTIVGALTDITVRKRSEGIRQVLYDISNAATSSNNLSELIRLIHKQLGKLIDTRNFFIALYDEDSDSIILQYIKDESEQISSFPAGKTLTSYVIKTQKSLLAKKDRIYGLAGSGDIELIGELSKVWLGVPLKLEDRVIGVLVVQSYIDENAYNESDLELLEFVSDQISVSIGRKQAEEDIKNALEKSRESDRLKSVFLGTMSHEFRTPLNTIIGFSEIIDKDTPADEVLDFVKTINASGKQLLDLVEDIFGISAIETGEIKVLKEEFVLDSFMHDIHIILEMEQQQSGKGNIEIVYNNSEEDKDMVVYTDARKLHQVLVNLLKNALKFTDEGYIEYGYTPAVINDISQLKFFVKDTGIGIAKEKQEFIFDIFRQGDDTLTRRYDGVGIGLSVSKKLTELLGGQMWLESEAGKGSCFYFTIPYIPQIVQ